MGVVPRVLWQMLPQPLLRCHPPLALGDVQQPCLRPQACLPNTVLRSCVTTSSSNLTSSDGDKIEGQYRACLWTDLG